MLNDSAGTSNFRSEGRWFDPQNGRLYIAKIVFLFTYTDKERFSTGYITEEHGKNKLAVVI